MANLLNPSTFNCFYAVNLRMSQREESNFFLNYATQIGRDVRNHNCWQLCDLRDMRLMHKDMIYITCLLIQFSIVCPTSIGRE